MKARRRRRGQNPQPYRERDRWKFKYRIDQAQPDGSVKRVQKTKVLARADEMSFSEACREAREFVTPIDELKPGVEHSERSMADLIQRWQEAIAPNLKRSTCESYEWAFKRIKPAFGVFKVSEIERPDVQRFLTGAGRKLAPESVHDLRARLRGLLSVAVEWGWIGANPAAGRLRLPKRHHTRKKRILIPNQLWKLVLLLKPPYNVIVLLAVLAGLRKGEIEALRWSDIGKSTVTVDEASYFGTLDTPKSERSNRRVAFGTTIRTALQEWRQQARFTGSDDFVFAIRTNTPIDLHNAAPRHLKPACRQAGIPEVSWHDLRHTYTTWGRKAGVSPEAMRDLLGHESVKTTLDVYSHVDDQDAAVMAIEDYALGGKLLPLSVTPPDDGVELTH